ncbi:ABC transporter permease [Ochrovirga pacifica]|uniref:ABC transporter permease n=1 Tax=Ochrovirga pacifica TaxID=1042376 RepID=UPI000255A2AA|nr:ABC transporter permease [Ochrovirga pacifica]
MNLWFISIKNIKSKPLHTVLSVLTLSFSLALLLGIAQIKHSFEQQIQQQVQGIDLIVGAKGSPIQLVLSALLHLDKPTGNIAYQEALKLSQNRHIKFAVPISYGDNYLGYRIVGTTPDFKKLYNTQLLQGTWPQKKLEVVIGSQVAKELRLQLGATFKSAHGLMANEHHVHQEEFTVVGILNSTNKVTDRLILTPLESIWEVHQHKEHNAPNLGHGENSHQQSKEITAILIRFNNPMALLTLPKKINKDTHLQAALPKYELNKLYQFTNIGLQTIATIAYFVLMIAGFILFSSLYKMVQERSYDLALMRTYGASRLQLLQIVLYEGIMIVSLSLILGILFTNISTAIFKHNLPQHLLNPLPLQAIIQIGCLTIGVTFLAVLLAVAPIFNLNIAKQLNHEK